MREIPLTQGKVAIVDDKDFDFLNQWKWCAERATKAVGWYAKRAEGPRCAMRFFRMHVQLLGRRDELLIDHKNGNGLDNRRDNLRWANWSQNMIHARKQNRFGRGVKFVDGRFAVQIAKNKKQWYIGRFDTPLEAQSAYNRAALDLHGEFATLNLNEHGQPL